jgi:hypothetical protein
MSAGKKQTDRNTERAINVLSAGASALLLSIAHLRPQFWFISFFALLPFLWRLRRLNAGRAVTLGITLAVFFVLGNCADDLIGAPKTFLVKLLSFGVAFGFFAYIVRRATRKLGFDPLFVALVWLPIEFVLIRFAGLESIFTIADSGSPFIVRFCALFGVLLGSLVVLWSNSFLLLIIQRVGDRMPSRSRAPVEILQPAFASVTKEVSEGGSYSLPHVRAPP